MCTVCVCLMPEEVRSRYHIFWNSNYSCECIVRAELESSERVASALN